MLRRMWWWVGLLVLLGVLEYAVWRDIRGSEADRYLDRFRLGAKRPVKPWAPKRPKSRWPFLDKIREARESRARVKSLIRGFRHASTVRDVAPGLPHDGAHRDAPE